MSGDLRTCQRIYLIFDRCFHLAMLLETLSDHPAVSLAILFLAHKLLFDLDNIVIVAIHCNELFVHK